ncbi:hypothetical protein AX27061_4920 [Achromobacter xylosoxidans NBRC 15126 = ATCC 27061]|nr:hypothetical protein AX27061_4920 [Achromobacter xylosoxidans NBRC 15126 = ATCC 27061]
MGHAGVSWRAVHGFGRALVQGPLDGPVSGREAASVVPQTLRNPQIDKKG